MSTLPPFYPRKAGDMRGALLQSCNRAATELQQSCNRAGDMRGGDPRGGGDKFRHGQAAKATFPQLSFAEALSCMPALAPFYLNKAGGM